MKDIAVPLNDEAIQMIRQLIGNNQKFVFTYKGKSATGCNNNARKALKRVGIENFRGTIPTHMSKLTHSEWNTVARLTGIRQMDFHEMVQRYAHLSPGHLSAYADSAKAVTNLLHFEKRGTK